MSTTPIKETKDNMLPMLTRKSWEEFRATGLFMFVNSILHVFGWTLAAEVKAHDGGTAYTDEVEVIQVYPARTRFRGFADIDTEEMHKKLGAYIKETSDELFEESR